MTSASRQHPDEPEFVPEEFQEQHLAEARRQVAASHRRRHRLTRGAWRRLATLEDTTAPHPRLRMLLVLMYGVAGGLLLVFAGLTDTWIIGGGMFAVTTAAFGLSLVVLGRLPDRGRRAGPGPGPNDRASHRR